MKKLEKLSAIEVYRAGDLELRAERDVDDMVTHVTVSGVGIDGALSVRLPAVLLERAALLCQNVREDTDNYRRRGDNREVCVLHGYYDRENRWMSGERCPMCEEALKAEEVAKRVAPDAEEVNASAAAVKAGGGA